MAKFQSELTLPEEAQLADFIASFYAKPYEFVLAVFPWGERQLPDGSPNPLANKSGPEPWQAEILQALGRHIRDNQIRREIGLDMKVWRSAVGSGHGVGKSALVAWIIYFLMSTRVDTRGAVTASTQFQLEDKTWPELGKWHKLALNKHWFRWSATAFSFAAYPEDQQKNYRTSAATVSEENTEAFAGLHNEGKSLFAIFDEASGVAPKLWEVVEGVMYDGEAFFFAFGNLTRPDGEFVDCFEKHSELYYNRSVDSRDVSFTNKSAIADTIKKYGLDSDEVRVRILGMKPRQSHDGFIMPWAYDEAGQRELEPDTQEALIMGVDVARFGSDSSVIRFRQGRDHRSFPRIKLGPMRTTALVRIIADEYNAKRPDRIVLESTGPGAGVIDQLKDLGYPVTEVHPGSAADDFDKFANKRAENWSRMRDWLYEGGCVDPDDGDLREDLISIRYTLDTAGEQKMRMERKEEMKKRGIKSPDDGDALALTFAVKPARRDRNNVHSARRGALALMQDDPLPA